MERRGESWAGSELRESALEAHDALLHVGGVRVFNPAEHAAILQRIFQGNFTQPEGDHYAYSLGAMMQAVRNNEMPALVYLSEDSACVYGFERYGRPVVAYGPVGPGALGHVRAASEVLKRRNMSLLVGKIYDDCVESYEDAGFRKIDIGTECSPDDMPDDAYPERITNLRQFWPSDQYQNILNKIVLEQHISLDARTPLRIGYSINFPKLSAFQIKERIRSIVECNRDSKRKFNLNVRNAKSDLRRKVSTVVEWDAQSFTSNSALITEFMKSIIHGEAYKEIVNNFHLLHHGRAIALLAPCPENPKRVRIEAMSITERNALGLHEVVLMHKQRIDAISKSISDYMAMEILERAKDVVNSVNWGGSEEGGLDRWKAKFAPQTMQAHWLES